MGTKVAQEIIRYKTIKQEFFLLLTRVLARSSALRFRKGQASYTSLEIKQKYAEKPGKNIN